MMNSVVFALVISSAAVGAWSALMFRMLVSILAREEHRPFMLAMPFVGMVASIGTLASAIGFGIQTGDLALEFDPNVLSFIASMGRGALLMGGIIGLGYYHPPHTK